MGALRGETGVRLEGWDLEICSAEEREEVGIWKSLLQKNAKRSGFGNNQNQNQRYEARVGFPGYQARVGFKSTVFMPYGMNRV